MSGPNESATPTPRTVEQCHKELLAELDRQQARLALPPQPAQIKNSVTPFMDLTQAQIRSMTAQECEEGAVLLQQLAFYVQRHYNRCQAVMDWCEERIRLVIAPDVGKMTGYSLEERRPLAVSRSPIAMKIQAVKSEAQSKLADIAYIPQRVENQARRLSDLAKTKVKQHG